MGNVSTGPETVDSQGSTVEDQRPTTSHASANGNTVLTPLESEAEENNNVTKPVMPMTMTKFRPAARRTMNGAPNAGLSRNRNNMKLENSFLDGVLKVRACNR